MKYKFTQITSKPDCEALVTVANQIKDELFFRKSLIDHDITKTAAGSTGVEADFQAATVEAATLQTTIGSLPEGSVKQVMVDRLTRVTYKLFLLTQRKQNYGALSLIEKEFDVGRIEKEIEEADAFIQQVTDYMNGL